MLGNQVNYHTLAMSIPRFDVDCNCWAGTIRVISQCQAAVSPSSTPLTSSSPAVPNRQSDTNANPAGPPLSDVLALGRSLADQWEVINTCVHSIFHLLPTALRFLHGATISMLTLYEKVIDEIARQLASPAPTFGGQPPGADATRRPSVFVGSLQLGQEESAIVIQEALRHSLIRLGAMLEEIDEAAQRRIREGLLDDGQPMEDLEAGGTLTRIHQLLQRVNTLPVAVNAPAS